MKKFLSIACLTLVMIASKAYSQNITWVFKDKAEKGFFKTHTTLNSKFAGFNNKEESATFISKLKAYSEIANVQVSNTDAKGNFDVVLTMKQIHDKSFYAGLAQKFGVTYIEYNGKKKTPAEILKGNPDKQK